MEFRMEERTPTLVAGYSCYGLASDPLFGLMWAKFNAGACMRPLDGAGGCYGIEFYDEASMDGGKFFYMAAARLPRIEDLPEDMVAKLLPGGARAPSSSIAARWRP